MAGAGTVEGTGESEEGGGGGTTRASLRYYHKSPLSHFLFLLLPLFLSLSFYLPLTLSLCLSPMLVLSIRATRQRKNTNGIPCKKKIGSETTVSFGQYGARKKVKMVKRSNQSGSCSIPTADIYITPSMLTQRRRSHTSPCFSFLSVFVFPFGVVCATNKQEENYFL